MSDITLKTEANQQSLEEYDVGRANGSCLYPGIAQCFAIAGRRHSFMACTHISPGATAEHFADTFAYLREIGGNWVTSWHVIGPFANHFSRRSAHWKSVENIKKTFDDEFPNSSAERWILDVSAQRNSRVMIDVDGQDMLSKYNSIDVKADLAMADNKIRFFYKGDRGANKDTWNRLYNKSFTRF